MLNTFENEEHGKKVSGKADVFAAEGKYPDEELTTAKDIARSILMEALHSVLVQDSTRIGDCNVGEEFTPGFDCFPVNCSESALEEENKCREEKSKEYRVIKEQALADGELRFQNGKIHLQSNGAKAIVSLSNLAEICPAKEVNKSQSCVKGGSHKKVDSSSENVLVVKSGQEKPEECSKEVDEENFGDWERPFTPFTTEDLRKSILQVWQNVDSSVLNGWDGKLVNQPQEVVRLMEELATIQVTPKATVDPNRPRACNFVEEDVKKQMIKEIEKMNFKSNVSSDEVANATPNEGILAVEEKVKMEETEAADKREEERLLGAEVAHQISSGSASVIQSEKFHRSLDLNTKEDIFTVSLTESDEAFIEASESVIQIIEPQNDSNDEDEGEEGKRITFSLLNEHDKDVEMMDDNENHQAYDDDMERQEEDGISWRYRSGMTTVGPIKNPNFDPKLLTGPEVDYGKMTRISGSCELTKERGEGSLRSSSSRKTLLDDGDDSPLLFFENSYMEIDTIVNHDIASLTKMQKVKEVLSDQPKSDEDLRGDEKLMRSPLDLKDLDADSCDSYNVIDIGIPLLTIDGTNRSNVDKDIRQVPVTEYNFRNAESEENTPTMETSSAKVEDHLLISSSFSCNKSVTQLNTGQNQKHNTISRVFQKASNRFIIKDSDSFLRNSRSLPRDTGKITNTESFRSLLDDCQTSAATVLKKSRSLLRNTQNTLKTVSKTGFSHVVSGDKQISVEKSESRQSTSSRKNEFLKLKDTIKNKVGKTLKSLENMRASSEVTEQSENQKKPSPKSPLVCPNQLPPKKSPDNRNIEGSGTVMKGRQSESADGQQGNLKFESDDEGTDIPDKEIEVICGVKFQGTRRFNNPNGYFTSQYESNDASSENVDDVVMETVPDGSAPAVGEENAERPKSPTGGLTEIGILAESKKSLTLPVDTNRDVHAGSDALHKSLSNGKLTNRKNKKLSARIRSFWQTAFGKVKATTQKKDLS